MRLATVFALIAGAALAGAISEGLEQSSDIGNDALVRNLNERRSLAHRAANCVLGVYDEEY